MSDVNKINETIAIQETYGERFQHCWGCGPKNDDGMHMKSYPAADGKSCTLKVTPDQIYTGGVPHNLFGGMIAMIFDCHGTASAAFFKHHDMGLDFDQDTVIGRFITSHLEVDYKKPVPIGEEILVTATPEEIGERKVIVKMEMQVAGEVRAEARMVAVGVKDDM